MEPTHDEIAVCAYYLWQKNGWNLKEAGYTVQAMRDWCWSQAKEDLAEAKATVTESE